MYVPVMTLALERGRGRRWVGAVLLAAGVVCAGWLGQALVTGPVRARADHLHIAYSVDLWLGTIPIALYVVSTCGALLCSSRPFLRRFGAANLAAVALLASVSTTTVISLWCLWAAATSVSIAWYLRRGDVTARPHPTPD